MRHPDIPGARLFYAFIKLLWMLVFSSWMAMITVSHEQARDRNVLLSVAMQHELQYVIQSFPASVLGVCLCNGALRIRSLSKTPCSHAIGKDEETQAKSHTII
jgi:hypothetical protein